MKISSKKRSKKLWVFIILLGIVCTPFYIIHNKIGYFRNLMMPKQAGGMPMLEEVPVIKIQKKQIQKTHIFPAKTVATKVAEIRPQITGIITKVMFKEGSFVKKGDKLYQIDPAEKITILAPISGHISRSFIREGSLVSANQSEPLTTITQLNPIYVDTPIPSSALSVIKSKDNDVYLYINGKKYKYKGKIQFSEVFVNQNTDSFIVRARFPNPNGDLLAGMYVNVNIVSNEGMEIAIPQRTVKILPDTSMAVMVVEKDGTVSQKAISVKSENNNNWIIKDGLQERDLLIYEGFQKIQNGMKVKHKIISLD